MASTTIKVTVELRERVSREAKRRGVTAAALLAEALDELDRQQRWEDVRQAYASLPADEGYGDEVRAWDVTLSDGLRRTAAWYAAATRADLGFRQGAAHCDADRADRSPART